MKGGKSTGVGRFFAGLYDFLVLENLDSIEWSNINHAYGSATDVPKLLRDLASANEKHRKDALWELHGNIWHQNTVYEATAHAVPFLLELVRNEVPDKLEILCLLALIANGTSYLQIHRPMMSRWSEDDEIRMQQEMRWVAAARAVVAGGNTLFLELLSSSDRKIREVSLYLLGCVGREDSSEVDPVDVMERIISPVA